MAQVIGTRVVALRHRINLGAPGLTVHVSPVLPYPGIIREIAYFLNVGNADSAIAAVDFYLSADASTAPSPITGDRLTYHELAGASPPDLTNDAPEALMAPTTGHEIMYLPMHVAIAGQGRRLKTALRQTTLTGAQLHVWVIVDLLDKPEPVGAEEIVPRGTPEEPVCVRICPPEAPPPPPPPPPPPTPPGPPPPVPGEVDVLALPLPLPSDIEPAEPLVAGATVCRAP